MGFQNVEETLSCVGGKVLIFGKQGTGKSTFTGTFPDINLVDTEDGQTYYIGKNPNIKGIMRTVSATEVQETLDELNDEDVIGSFNTIVIDSGTKLYENMQAAAFEIAESRARKQYNKGKDIDLDDINLAQRDWGHIKRFNQRLATSYILFSTMGKWCVVTAHQKDETRDATKQEKDKLGVDRIKIGEIPDLAKKAEHDFDIVIQTYTETDKDTGEEKYFAKILKDRTQVTKRGDIIENPTFEVWRENWEQTKQYGIKKGVNLSESIKKDVEQMKSEEDSVDDLIAEWKAIMKSFQESKNKDAVAKINAKIKELEISVTKLASCTPEQLTELLEFSKTFA